MPGDARNGARAWGWSVSASRWNLHRVSSPAIATWRSMTRWWMRSALRSDLRRDGRLRRTGCGGSTHAGRLESAGARGMDRRDPRRAQARTDFHSDHALRDQLARVDLQRGAMPCAQGRGLRVGAVLHPEPATLVGFADDRELPDPFGFAEAVAACDQVVHGVVAQF